MNIIFEKVLERDMDLLFINSFNKYKDFTTVFGFNGYNVLDIEHSNSDNDGESDITIILEKDGIKTGLLIEDKIDAIAMPNQCARYDLRGNSGIKNGKYDSYVVYLLAPKDYIESNSEAKKYKNRIDYETLLVFYKTVKDEYAISLINKALEEKKIGYSVIEDKTVTDNWMKYYDYIDKHYPTLPIKKNTNAKGSYSLWPFFTTGIKEVELLHKTNKGYADLQLSGMLEDRDKVYELVKDSLDDDMFIAPAGKSISIRIMVPIVDFHKDVYLQGDELDKCFSAIKRLHLLLNKVNFNTLFNKN